MYSSRIFSQEGELSQITPFSGDLNPAQEVLNENESLNDINQIEQHEDSDYQDSGNAYNQNAPEEPLSSRADAICEENRQIRHIVESNLKKMEKKRLKLIEKLNELDTELESKSELHEAQSQKLVQLQMDHEEWTEKYKAEIGQRSSLLEKMKHIQDLVELFSIKYAEGVEFGAGIKNDLIVLKTELDDSQYQSIIETKKQMIEHIKSEFEQQLLKAQQIRKEIEQKRETNIAELKSLAFEKDEQSSKIKNYEERIHNLTQNVQEVTNMCDKLEIENKSYKDKIAKTHQELYEIRKTNALQIQDLKLKINNEENKNKNLESKSKEAEYCSNVLNTKLNNQRNLRDQLSLAIEESTKTIETQVKEIEKQEEQIKTLSKEKEHLVEELKKYENVDEINKDVTHKISELEAKNEANEIKIKEKESKIAQLANEIERKKQNYKDIEENISKLNEELEQSYKIKDELELKVNNDFASYEEERERNLRQNKTMEQINADLKSQIDQMSKQLTEELDHNESLSKTIDHIKESIENHTENIKRNEMKITSINKEYEEEISALNGDIEIIQSKLEYYEELLIEAKPKEDELPELQSTKLKLEQEIKNAEENFNKEKESLENHFKAKLLEMDKEQEKYSSIMESLLLAEEEATEKLKVEIKETEQIKSTQEQKIKSLQNQLNSLKRSEMSKRNKIVSIERRLQTINKEMKVTRQDISDAITGKSQLIKRPRKYGKENKCGSKNDDLSLTSQISTNKWENPSSIYDYEFSDV